MPLPQSISYFLLGVILVIILDSIGAILSNRFNFKYMLLIPASVLVYGLTGFLLGKSDTYLMTSLLTGLLGLFDGTIGLKLSIYFKARMGLSQEQIESMQSRTTAFFMVIVGVLFGSLGFAISTLIA